MSAAFGNHLQETAARVFVLLMSFQMLGELVNLLGQERHLHGRRTGVLGVDPAGANNFLLFLS